MRLKRITLAFAIVLLLGVSVPAQTFTTLHNFTGGADGTGPDAGVIQDPAGDLYGATDVGGNLNCNASSGCGVVFELNTAGTETVLHTFSGNPDGEYPYMPVARDKAGNIYGTTFSGGSSSCEQNYGCGTVFKIDTAGNETVLHSFTGGSDSCNPWQGLLVDDAGTLFGTTWGYFCSSTYGTIFKLDSAGKFTTLHHFTGYPSDGANPRFGHLTMDKCGNLYGVTYWGGAYNGGALYKLSTKGKLILLYSFGSGWDSLNPEGSVVLDEAGNLYGTSSWGGPAQAGTIWKVNRKGKETILHSFGCGRSDGCYTHAGVTRDSKGNLYGVAYWGGANDWGALYKLSACGRLVLLHSFDFSDGANPIGEVLRTDKGTLFGTTDEGGTGYCNGWGCGTVWSYVP